MSSARNTGKRLCFLKQPPKKDSSTLQHTSRLLSRSYPGSDECYLHYKVPVEQNEKQTNTLGVALH